MARPPKSPDFKMDAELRIRVTAEQRRLVQEAAHLEQSDMSVWARAALVRAAKERIAAKSKESRRKPNGDESV